MRIAVLVVVAACGANGAPVDYVDRERVALVPVVERSDLDLLFVLDDSPGGLELQTSFKNAFAAFQAELTARHELPSLHIGVVSSDIGTQGAEDSQPGPNIGSGPGSCSGVGKNAALQTNNTTLVSGTFISDTRDVDGTRTTNYSGSLATAFAAIASLGGSGCGFEQPIEAIKRALDNHPANAGFLRAESALAIIMITDEDDCSFAHSTLLGADVSVLGPLQSFRCTQFGVRCEDGGASTTEMAIIGTKGECRWREDGSYLTSRARYLDFLSTLKSDRRDVLFTAIAGPANGQLEVEPRAAPGGGTPIAALKHSCVYNGMVGVTVADPAVRIEDLAQGVARSQVFPVCDEDQTTSARAIAREIRGMLGDSCLTRDIALPADCEVFDQTLTRETAIAPCSAAKTMECYRLVEDAACTTSQHLRVDVMRSTTPPTDTMVAVRCRL